LNHPIVELNNFHLNTPISDTSYPKSASNASFQRKLKNGMRINLGSKGESSVQPFNLDSISKSQNKSHNSKTSHKISFNNTHSPKQTPRSIMSGASDLELTSNLLFLNPDMMG
jgi:hypothetical protein